MAPPMCLDECDKWQPCCFQLLRSELFRELATTGSKLRVNDLFYRQQYFSIAALNNSMLTVNA